MAKNPKRVHFAYPLYQEREIPSITRPSFGVRVFRKVAAIPVLLQNRNRSTENPVQEEKIAPTVSQPVTGLESPSPVRLRSFAILKNSIAQQTAPPTPIRVQTETTPIPIRVQTETAPYVYWNVYLANLDRTISHAHLKTVDSPVVAQTVDSPVVASVVSMQDPPVETPKKETEVPQVVKVIRYVLK